jgi:tetratricopeptide (TPR) repeat protein
MTRVESERAIALLKDALARFEALGDVLGAGTCLTDLGINALNQGDAAVAASHFERGLADALEHRATDADRAIGLSNLAGAYFHLGQLDAAQELATEALALAETAGRSYNKAAALGLLSRLALARGEITRAATLVRESLAISRELEDPWFLVQAVENAVAVMSAAQRAQEATRIYAAASTLHDAISSPLSGLALTQCERDLASLRSILGAAGFSRAWAEGQRLPLEEAIAAALTATAEIALEAT